MMESGIERESGRQQVESACAGALAALPLQTHRRLRRLIALGPPSHTWAEIRRGHRPLTRIDESVWRAWTSRDVSTPAQIAESCARADVTVVTIGDEAYPHALINDPAAPAVLFIRGDVSHLRRRRVGIVGTRSASPGARRFARVLGEMLAANSVCVVSGLARGIDVEAHLGSLNGMTSTGSGPAAVVASGPDVVYPKEHQSVWDRVCANGVLISEAPPGVQPTPHMFPLRNRILAALSEVLVVVESRRTGGSMSTVREAMNRDVTVMAVPGSPQNSACVGTNELIRDGCAPVTDVDDVLVALGLDTRRAAMWCDVRQPPEGDEVAILHALGTSPRSIDEVSMASSMSALRAAVLLGRLEAKGWVGQSDGWWEPLAY